MKGKKWKAQEEAVIVECVNRHGGGNLRGAFAEAATIISRTEKSICVRFYNTINKKLNLVDTWTASQNLNK